MCKLKFPAGTGWVYPRFRGPRINVCLVFGMFKSAGEMAGEFLSQRTAKLCFIEIHQLPRDGPIIWTYMRQSRTDYLQARNARFRAVPSSVKAYISYCETNFSPYRSEKQTKRPESYGVYLGEFDNPPSRYQMQILSEWDLLIFDPSQAGMVDAMSSGLYPVSPQSLARLDVELVVGGSSRPQIVCLVEWIARHIEHSTKVTGHHCCFTGLVISNWGSYVSTAVLETFIHFLSSLGLSVYLEVSAPNFLPDVSLAGLDEVTGLVICNGTINPNGEERDAFQMAAMRPTIKAFVSQACLRSFEVLLWETLNDDAEPLNAVVKRSYQWSKFYSALPWIGSVGALTSAEMSLCQQEPLGAFDWLKELKVMKIHEKWRTNQLVSLLSTSMGDF